ncbi:uncharacterized protein C9orf85 homolog [Vanessa cardui]|uniref:uncharacterized protein C9orf85 homolog n=1 Tax=Vanessa cardui TaxID=171605 RepID=UPI001F12A3D8|nr:uncharacterized protein C9orf85 homolog [Vanessa cardui]
MSCSRGNTTRTRPQKHQNRTVFKNTLHDTSKKTKLLNNLEVTGVCERCKGIIEWKIKYKKYKPLTVPGKCVSCEQRNIKHAYHVMCNKCATEKKVCTKCCKPSELIVEKKSEDKVVDNEIKYQSILKNLSERKRRTFLRHLKKQESEGIEVTKLDIDAFVIEMGKKDFENDSDDDLNFSDLEI